MDNTWKTVAKALLIIGVFYLTIFYVWFTTSPEHKPSNMFADWRREGYQVNPLHDRKRAD